MTRLCWPGEILIPGGHNPVRFLSCKIPLRGFAWRVCSDPLSECASHFLYFSLCVSSSLLGIFQMFCLVFLLFCLLLCYYFYLFLLFPSSISSLKTEENFFRYSSCIFCGYNDKADDRNIAAICLLFWTF